MSGWLFRCTDRVGVDAPVAHSVGICLEICHLLLTAREIAVDGGSAAPVVGLISDVASVAENDNGSDWKVSGDAKYSRTGCHSLLLPGLDSGSNGGVSGCKQPLNDTPPPPPRMSPAI